MDYQFVYKPLDEAGDTGNLNPQPIFTGLMYQTSSNMEIGVAVRRSRSPISLLTGILPN